MSQVFPTKSQVAERENLAAVCLARRLLKERGQQPDWRTAEQVKVVIGYAKRVGKTAGVAP